MQFRSFAFIPNPISKLNGILPWIYPGSDADIPVPPMHFSISAATGIHWPSIVISMSPKKGNCVRAQAFHGCGIASSVSTHFEENKGIAYIIYKHMLHQEKNYI